MTTHSSSAKDQKTLKWSCMTGGVHELPTNVAPQIPSRYPWSIPEEKTALVKAASQDVGLQPDTNAPVVEKKDKPGLPRPVGREEELQELGAMAKVQEDEGNSIGGDDNGR